MSDVVKLNIGSGHTRYDGWLNVDADPTTKPDHVGDVRDLPFKDNSVNMIFASHILEHIPFDVDVVKEWKRVLMPGGKLMVAVPDISQMIALREAGMVDHKYFLATIYGSQMYGHPKETMSHYRVYTPHLLLVEMLAHFQLLHIGPTANMPRKASMGECCIEAVK